MTTDAAKKFIGLSSFQFLAMFRRGLFYAYLTIYLRHFLGLTVTATTLFATLPMLVNVLSQTFIWGRVSDHFQLRRTLIVAGECLAALGTVSIWYLHRLPDDPRLSGYIIIIGLSLIELFWSMSNISWSALVSDLYTETDRSTIQGRLTSMGGMGRIMGIWIGGILYDGFKAQFAGWGFYNGDLFFVAAGVMALSTLPLFLLPEGGIHSSIQVPESPDRSLPEEPVDHVRIFIAFLISMTLINFGRNSIAIIFPQYLMSESGLALDSRTIGLVLNTQSAAIVCFGWIVGWLCRKIGTKVTLLAASSSAVVSMIILAACTQLWLVYLGSFLRGVADAAILASAYELASVFIPPVKRARRFAWFNATFFLSWGLPGTLVVGPLVDFLISRGYAEPIAYRASFVFAAGLVLLGLVAMTTLLYLERRGKSLKFRIISSSS